MKGFFTVLEGNVVKRDESLSGELSDNFLLILGEFYVEFRSK